MHGQGALTWVPNVMKEARSTDAECSSKVLRQLPEFPMHGQGALTWVPNVMKEARSTEAECPSKVLRQLPSVRAHRRTVASPLPVSRHWSIGENCTLHTPLLCPFSVSVCTRSGSRHTCKPHSRHWSAEKCVIHQAAQHGQLYSSTRKNYMVHMPLFCPLSDGICTRSGRRCTCIVAAHACKAAKRIQLASILTSIDQWRQCLNGVSVSHSRD